MKTVRDSSAWSCEKPLAKPLSTPIDVVRAASEAVEFVLAGKHDPFVGHERIKNFYHWDHVTTRTEKVYEAVMKSPQMNLMERIAR